jgi:cholesterol oxidase
MIYDAIVIGTGFGGAVSALRLVQAGFRIAVLERGRRYPRGAFPRNWKDPLDGWLWRHRQGLFDARSLSGMQVVQSAGYGGGSLIYANVHLRPAPDLFRKRWPEGYDREALDPYYDLVAGMLELRTVDGSNGQEELPPKTRLMEQVAVRLGRGGQFVHTPIAVRFGPREDDARNRFGVPQRNCTGCGECDIGCNVHAKNTLDLNYLAMAEARGAEVLALREATCIEPSPAGYRVQFRNHTTDTLEALESRRVFVCAGAINSTELLLRSRPRLPRLSDALGHGYSGNGDFLAFGLRTRDAWRAFQGPTITTGLVYDRGVDDERVSFILEDGGFPVEIARLLGFLDPNLAWLKGELESVRSELESMVSAGSDRPGTPNRAEHEHAAVFLAMGRDRADGVIRLSPTTEELCIDWPLVGNMPLYAAEEQLVADVARELGGVVALDPFWRRLRIPVSVHNLGGCTMADRPAEGVTDGTGQVHYYPGLYVLDGAILPTATGVNPSHTIAAVAERNIEHIIRQWKGDSEWRAPERAEVSPFADPLDRVVVPVGGTLPPRTPATGLRFTETMRGALYLGPDADAIDFTEAERLGRKAGCAARFTVTILTNDLDAFLADKDHAASAVGSLHVDGLTGRDGAHILSGSFNLFVEVNGATNERRMTYLLPFVGAEGQPYVLDGFKAVRGNVLQVWPATTTLYVRVRRVIAQPGATPGGHPEREVVAAGVLHIGIADFLHQLTTFRVTGTDAPDRQAEAFARFGALFAGTLAKVFRPRFSEGFEAFT